jgi:hypothetical protein
MLTRRFLLIITLLWTLRLATSETPHDSGATHLRLIVVPIPPSSLSGYQTECHESCVTDYCYEYASLNRNCTKLIRDQCDCCTVCLRKENEVCGGRFNVYGICEEDLLCYKSNQTATNQTGICLKGEAIGFRRGERENERLSTRSICSFSMFEIPVFIGD